MKSRRLWIAAFILFASLATWGAWAWFRNPAEGISGIYLTEGGLGYLVIGTKSDDHRSLTIKDAEWLLGLDTELEWRFDSIKWTGQRLRIEIKSKHTSATNPNVSEEGPTSIREFAASDRIQGDFDLVGYSNPSYRNPTRTSSPKVFIPSFLHRMDDDLVLDYFRAQRKDNDSGRAFDIALQLLAGHPNDLHIRALFMEAALKRKDFATLKIRNEIWRAEFEKADDPYLKRVPAIADYMLKSKELTDSGKNGAAVMERLTEYLPQKDPKADSRAFTHDLNEWFAGMDAFNRCEGFMNLPTELNPARIHGDNYLAIQVLPKVTSTGAVFLMFQGRGADARHLLIDGYSFGNGRAETGTLIERLIGIAIKSFELHRLSLYALNFCVSEPELEELANALDPFANGPRDFKPEDMGFFLNPPFQQASTDANWLDASTRFKVVVAKYEILRAAIAARREHLKNRKYPSVPEDFKTWLTGGLPPDPFGSGPLKFFESDGDYSIYSVGPDGQDDHASVMYDPTNGYHDEKYSTPISGGDIFTRIPKEREFPFPPDGLKARTPEDIHRQFPNGLPVDFFARTRNRGFGISAGPPLRIYSFGPDSDEMLMPAGIGENYVVEPMYDPTNGLWSNGDLYIDLPAE